MPRKGYKTITVKADCLDKFLKEKNKTGLDNSKFIIKLLHNNKRLHQQEIRIARLEKIIR